MILQAKNVMAVFIISVFCGVQSLCAGRLSKRLKKQEAHEQLILAEREAEALRTKRLEHKHELQEAKHALDAKLERRRLRRERKRACTQAEKAWTEIKNLQDLIPFIGHVVAYELKNLWDNKISCRYVYVNPHTVQSIVAGLTYLLGNLCDNGKSSSVTIMCQYSFYEGQCVRMRFLSSREKSNIHQKLESHAAEFAYLSNDQAISLLTIGE